MTITYAPPRRPAFVLRYDPDSQCWRDRLGSVVRHPRMAKALKHLRLGNVDPIDPLPYASDGWDEAYVVRPIRGYNKRTYRVLSRERWPDGREWWCSCQGHKAYRRKAAEKSAILDRPVVPEDCAHIIAAQGYSGRMVVMGREP